MTMLTSMQVIIKMRTIMLIMMNKQVMMVTLVTVMMVMPWQKMIHNDDDKNHDRR